MIHPLLHQPHRGFSRDVDLANLQALLEDKHAVLWLDVKDPTAEELELLRREFGLHELALEDAAVPHRRPKLDEYDRFYFLVFYSLQLALPDGELKLAELDLFVGEGYLITVHRGPVPEIEEAQRRWERGHATLNHSLGSLVYALLDSLVDSYFDVADGIVEQVAGVEERVFEAADQRTVQSVFALKKRLLALRRVLGPERDALNVLMRQDLPMLDRKSTLYLRDVYDHLVRITDTVDLHSDLLTAALDAFLSTISNRLNQVMKTLTSAATILMTLALISGIYGMNFKNMPELEWPLGYAWSLGLMLVVGTSLFVYFRWKDWL